MQRNKSATTYEFFFPHHEALRILVYYLPLYTMCTILTELKLCSCSNDFKHAKALSHNINTIDLSTTNYKVKDVDS